MSSAILFVIGASGAGKTAAVEELAVADVLEDEAAILFRRDTL